MGLEFQISKWYQLPNPFSWLHICIFNILNFEYHGLLLTLKRTDLHLVVSPQMDF